MTEQITPSTKKRGPKPIGDAPMTPAERQRRRREQIRAGGAKEFLFTVEGLHLEYLEQIALHEQTNIAAALKLITQTALDRYIGVMRRCDRLRTMGASDADIEAFITQHFLQPLPDINELEFPRPDKN